MSRGPNDAERSTWRAWDVLAIAAIAAAGSWFVWSLLCQRPGMPSADIYGAQYPMLLHAWRALRRGQGFFWNRLQNCGQPFLPSTPPGTLYPLNLLFFVFGLERGWAAIGMLHLTIGGAAVFFLCRRLGASRVAALCGAFVFTLNGEAIDITSWLPTANLGAYVWLPVALLAVERLLERPTAGQGLLLGSALTLQLLAGCPQVSMFTYQLIALRVVWEVCTNRVRPRGAFAGALLLGLVLPAGLAAVQLLPSFEFARLSVRNRPLELSEMAPTGILGWAKLGTFFFPPFIGTKHVTIGSIALAVAAPLLPGRRRLALFYLAVLALYVTLAADGTAFQLYASLPLGRTFRFPSRFLWVATFALSVLAGIGTQTLLDAGRTPRTRWLGLGSAFVAACVFTSLGEGVTLQRIWLLLPAILAPALVAAAGGAPRAARLAGLCIAGVLLVDLHGASWLPFMTFFPKASPLWAHADAFKLVKQRMTPLDRVYSNAKVFDPALMAKSASAFDVPSILDYEPQTSRRYAEVVVKAAFNAELQTINHFNLAVSRPFVVRPLMDLLGARWLVVNVSAATTPAWLRAGYYVRWMRNDVAVFENLSALPRAYYVPRVEVMTDPRALLTRLAWVGHRPLEMALVEEVPADGFVGAQATVPASVSLSDRSERVTLRVTTPQPGFAVLTDQDYPGWEATVDGVPTPILRANYAFRAVRVPAGESVVVFRYRPQSLWLGAGISLATLAGMAVFVVSRLRRRVSPPGVRERVGAPPLRATTSRGV